MLTDLRIPKVHREILKTHKVIKGQMLHEQPLQMKYENKENGLVNMKIKGREDISGIKIIWFIQF